MDVTVIFHHAGEIIDDPHDWVLLSPGTLKPFLAVASRASDESGGIPPEVQPAPPNLAKEKTEH